MEILKKIENQLNEKEDSIVGEIKRNIGTHALKNLKQWMIKSAVMNNSGEVVVTIRKI